MIIIENAEVYSPEYLGKKDVLICGGKIVKIDKKIEIYSNSVVIERIDASGMKLVPGFIDQHLHIIGGGGEAGFYSRVPEVQFAQLIKSGLTTVLGLLGTDATCRSLEALYAKAHALETEGVTTYILTGSFEVPAVTFSGSIRRDIILIDKVIGIGEIAISDHRSSLPTLQEIKRIATEAKIGGMISGKAGVFHLHLGESEERLDYLFRIHEETDISLDHFIPTHINRERKLFNEAMEYAKLGGYMDITSGISPAVGFKNSIKPSKAIAECVLNNIPMNLVTMSSDGNGSMAVVNKSDQSIKLLSTKMDSLHGEFKDAVIYENVEMSIALATITSNVAKAMGLYPQKGIIAENSDADIILLDQDLNIDYVFAKGKKMMENKRMIAKGTFE